MHFRGGEGGGGRFGAKSDETCFLLHNIGEMEATNKKIVFMGLWT